MLVHIGILEYESEKKNVFVSTKTSFLLSCKNMLARLTALKNLHGIPDRLLGVKGITRDLLRYVAILRDVCKNKDCLQR